jgi:hypothetical protein
MVGAMTYDTSMIPCADGYAKMNDRCVACGGEAGAAVLGNFAVKIAMIFLTCAKLLEKATHRTCVFHVPRSDWYISN